MEKVQYRSYKQICDFEPGSSTFFIRPIDCQKSVLKLRRHNIFYTVYYGTEENLHEMFARHYFYLTFTPIF